MPILDRWAIAVLQNGAWSDDLSALVLSQRRLSRCCQANENGELSHRDTPEFVEILTSLTDYAARANTTSYAHFKTKANGLETIGGSISPNARLVDFPLPEMHKSELDCAAFQQYDGFDHEKNVARHSHARLRWLRCRR